MQTVFVLLSVKLKEISAIEGELSGCIWACRKGGGKKLDHSFLCYVVKCSFVLWRPCVHLCLVGVLCSIFFCSFCLWYQSTSFLMPFILKHSLSVRFPSIMSLKLLLKTQCSRTFSVVNSHWINVYFDVMWLEKGWINLCCT